MRMSIGIGPFRFYSKQRRKKRVTWGQVFQSHKAFVEQERQIKARKQLKAQRDRNAKPYSGPGWEQYK